MKNRLKHMRDFDTIYKSGRFFGGPLATAKVWKVEPEAYPRRKYTLDDLKIGFVVSTKVHKHAVERNRVKRQMREVVRLLLKENQLKLGYLIAVTATPRMIGTTYEEIEKNIIELLRRAQVMK